VEQPRLDLDDALLGVEDERLVLFELRRDIRSALTSVCFRI